MSALAGADISYSPTIKGTKEDHFSNLLLTLNTNWRPKTKEEARQQAQWLYAALRLFLTPRFLAPCVKLRGNTRIKALKISQWGVELGTQAKGQRIHAHSFLKFTHSGSMQLDPIKIKEQLTLAWREANPGVEPPKNFYVNVKWVPATDEMLRRYIAKQALKTMGLQ